MPFLPFAGKNSIVEALIGVQFAQPILPQIASNLDKLKAEFSPDFPKFEQMQQLNVTLGAAPMNFAQFPGQSAQPTVAGFSASLNKSDGKVVRLIRAYGNSASTHFLEYDHWSNTRGEALLYLQRCFNVLKIPNEHNQITGLQITFIDRFTYDGPVSEANIVKLVKETTEYLPHNVFRASGLGQSTTVWTIARGDCRTDHSLTVQSVAESNAAVIITHNQGRLLASAINSFEEAVGSGVLLRHLDEMHDENASILKNVLCDEMLKQIGLG